MAASSGISIQAETLAVMPEDAGHCWQVAATVKGSN